MKYYVLMPNLLNRIRRPDVTFYPGGRIDISSRIAQKLSIQKGDVIDVLAEKGEYMLYVRLRAEGCLIGRFEAQCYHANIGKHRAYNFRAHSRQLTEAVFLASQGTKDYGKPLRLPAGEPVTIEGKGLAIPLIIRNPL